MKAFSKFLVLTFITALCVSCSDGIKGTLEVYEDNVTVTDATGTRVELRNSVGALAKVDTSMWSEEASLNLVFAGTSLTFQMSDLNFKDSNTFNLDLPSDNLYVTGGYSSKNHGATTTKIENRTCYGLGFCKVCDRGSCETTISNSCPGLQPFQVIYQDSMTQYAVSFFRTGSNKKAAEFLSHPRYSTYKVKETVAGNCTVHGLN